MNNEMGDFTSKPGVPNQFGLVQGTANAVAPGKTPLSSMSPTVVTRDGHVAMAIGSPGGSRIITTTLEAVSNMTDYGMTVQEAIDAPRIHMQWLPDTIYLEPYALSPDTRKTLEAEGYRFTDGAPWGIAEGIPDMRPQALAACRLLRTCLGPPRFANAHVQASCRHPDRATWYIGRCG